MDQRRRWIVYFAQQLRLLPAEQGQEANSLPGQESFTEDQLRHARFLFLLYSLLYALKEIGQITEERARQVLQECTAALRQGQGPTSLISLPGWVSAELGQKLAAMTERLSGQGIFSPEERAILLPQSTESSISRIPVPVTCQTATDDSSTSWQKRTATGEGVAPGESQPPSAISETVANDSLTPLRKLTTAHKCITHLGPYEILAEIGAGGMGKVYQAYHPHLKRVVAIKVMLAQQNISRQDRERFLAEARITAGLKHPNIIGVHDLGSEEGTDYLVMDFIEGQSLAKILLQTSLTTRKSLEILREVGLAVEYAHQNGIIHRDLKPENIMIETQSGRPIVMDFGLAKNIKQDLTRSGEILGTPRYMAPEQVRGQSKEISPRTDVYALGAILYRMLTGSPVVDGLTPINIIHNILYGEVIPPRRYSPKVPLEVETICLKALEKNPRRRYPGARALVEEIERFLNHQPIRTRPRSPGFRAWRSLCQHKRWAILGLCLLVLGALPVGISVAREISKQRQATAGHIDPERIRAIMRELEKGIPERGIIDQCITDLVRMRGSQTATLLVEYLARPNRWQRRVAIESLGRLGDRQTQVAGKSIGEWLTERLKQLDVKNPEEQGEAQELIWALGRLREKTAFATATRVRWAAGEESEFWENTKIPYSWIPLEPGNELVDARTYRDRGRCRYDQGDLPGALADLSKAIELNPGLVNAYTDRGHIRYLLRNVSGALSDYEKAIAIDPAFTTAYNNRAYVRRQQGDLAGAIADCTKAIELDPKCAEAYDNRGHTRYLQGDLEGALGDLSKAIEANPQYARAYSNRGIVRVKSGDLAGAIADCSKAIELNPTYSDAYSNLGQAHYARGDLKRALADLNKAIELDPKLASAYCNRGHVRYLQGDARGAIADHSKAIELVPNFATAYNNRGYVRYNIGDLPAAMADLNKAIGIDPRQCGAYNNRGHVYFLQQDFDKALADFEKAIELDPQFAEAYHNRGSIRHLRGDLARALSDYNKAIQLNPRYALAYRRRGEALAKKGDHQAAVSDYRMYLQLQPKAPDAAKITAYLQEHRK